MARKRETRDVWQRRVARWAKSGLSRAEFAAREGVKPETLAWWRWALGVAKPSTSLMKREPAFVEVEAIAAVDVPQERIEVALGNGRVVRVPSTFDEQELGRVIVVAERA